MQLLSLSYITVLKKVGPFESHICTYICTKIKELVCFQFEDFGDFVNSGFGVMGF